MAKNHHTGDSSPTYNCKVCGSPITSPRGVSTCSPSCHGRLGGTAPSKRICQCGKPASKRGWCRDCAHKRKLASKREHYRRYRDRILSERRNQYFSDPAARLRLRELGKRQRFNGLRDAVVQRDGFACRHCGSGYSLVVHHVIPLPAAAKRRDARSRMDDLLTLCRSCHIDVHRSDLAAGKSG